MAVGKFYDDIDVILKSMIEYLGIDEEEDDFDDLFGDEEEDDDLLDVVCCTMADVDKCGNILENYIDNLVTIAKKPSDTAILAAIEKTVKKLNKLNEACECELIDATVSEDICDFIQKAAAEAGLPEIPEELWNEWKEF